jgi:hypothetical protein
MSFGLITDLHTPRRLLPRLRRITSLPNVSHTIPSNRPDNHALLEPTLSFTLGSDHLGRRDVLSRPRTLPVVWRSAGRRMGRRVHQWDDGCAQDGRGERGLDR